MSKCVEMKRQLNQDILADWLKVGTMMVVSRLLETRNVNKLQDKKWLETSLFTLLGFTAYHIVTKRVVTMEHTNEVVQRVLNTSLKVGTMLVVSRVLAQGSVTDEKWIRSSAYTLAGFAAYDVVTNRLVPQNLSGGMKATAQDAVNFGTMFVVSRMLEGGSLSDEKWIRSSLYTIAGFAAYNLVGQYLVGNVQDVVSRVTSINPVQVVNNAVSNVVSVVTPCENGVEEEVEEPVAVPVEQAPAVESFESYSNY